MSDATYVLGTEQMVELKIDVLTHGFTFDTAAWDVDVTLVPIGATLDEDTAVWSDTSLVTDENDVYAQVLFSELLAPLTAALDPLADPPTNECGKYHVWVKATPTGDGTEEPIFVSRGIINIVEAWG